MYNSLQKLALKRKILLQSPLFSVKFDNSNLHGLIVLTNIYE